MTDVGNTYHRYVTELEEQNERLRTMIEARDLAHKSGIMAQTPQGPSRRYSVPFLNQRVVWRTGSDSNRRGAHTPWTILSRLQ